MQRLFITALLVFIAGCTQPMTTVTIHTTQGDITVALDEKAAPKTVENFLSYADSGFYDDTVFHRVIPGFMIQGGGYTADGTRKETRAPIPLEDGLENERATIAMARSSDPDSATSQFFINVADNPQLDGQEGLPGYAAFGRVTSGMDVVDAIAAKETQARGQHQHWPVEDVAITSVERNQ